MKKFGNHFSCRELDEPKRRPKECCFFAKQIKHFGGEQIRNLTEKGMLPRAIYVSKIISI